VQNVKLIKGGKPSIYKKLRYREEHSVSVVLYDISRKKIC